MLRVLDLFSGIGGFAIGLEGAGMRTVQFVEVDPYCRAWLARTWPAIPIHDDIRTFRGEPGRYEVVCGGFPCQPVSYAGSRLGAQDDRWLWPEMRRVVYECRPTWVIGENVDGLDGLGLDEVLDDLEAIGYEVAPPLEIPACAAGAKHKRNRIWIMAHAPSNRLEGKLRQNRGETYWPPKAFSSPSFPSRQEQLPEPYTLRSLNGVPAGAHRIRALGNAVYPPLVEVIGRAILAAEGLQ